ncbi:MAG TPA: DNA repair protein RecO [Myxococcales bacterium]
MAMDLRAQRCEALVLRSIAYGDSDSVVHLLVRGHGRVSAFARGARSSRQRFGGALEPFGRIEALLAEREGLWALREARVIEAHGKLRDDLHRIAHAGYAAELAHDLAREGQPADALFALLQDFLERLAQAKATSGRLRALELLALEAAGLAPELRNCSRCGGEVPAGRAAFSPDAGGLLCGSCARGEHAIALGPGARAALWQLRWGGLAAADAPKSADGSGRAADLPAFEEACAAAAPAVGAFLRHHLGRALHSAEFLDQVGAPA